MSQVSHARFAVVRNAIVAGFSIVVGLGAATVPANAGSADGLSVSSVSAGIGSGVVAQTVTIASGSPIVGSSGAITISGSDGAFEVSGLTWDASTRGSCQHGSAPSPAWFYICSPSAAGWGAGSFHVAINTGSGAQMTCSVLVCSFDTTAAWSGPGGPEPSGSVTLTNEADLSVSLNRQAPANSVTLIAANNGPSRVSNAIVTVTGLGDYTVSNVEGQCTQSGSTLTCAEQLGSGQNLFVQPAFSGGSGPLTLHAVVSGYFQGSSGQVSEPDTNSANNSASLTWTPGAASGGGGGTGSGSGSGSSGGSGAGASTPAAPAASDSPPASAGASASPAAATASTSASATDAGTDSGSPSAVASTVSASSTRSAPLDAAPTGGSGNSGSTQLWALLAALCIVATGVTSAVLTGKGRHRA